VVPAVYDFFCFLVLANLLDSPIIRDGLFDIPARQRLDRPFYIRFASSYLFSVCELGKRRCLKGRNLIRIIRRLNMPATTKPVKVERVYSHPTMCLHCHLIVEMYHERGADPVKGSWQCPRCGHKYLFSHWKIKKQVRGKTEAA
jgi:hypothetical protein